MYIATIRNGDETREIHGYNEKALSGSIAKGINTIDSFSFSLLPSNAGFGELKDFQTLVKVWNTNKKRYDFRGRVLYSRTDMSEEGLITQEATCESYLGFLCDSQQPYVVERNWGKRELLEHLISKHNSQVEEYKRFVVGSVSDPNDNIYCGIQRQNTWDAINEKLLNAVGGEILLTVTDNADGSETIRLDYVDRIGETKDVEIALSKNLKSITREKDPTACVTRVIPLGCKIGDTEERLDITSINFGTPYIDDEDGIALYGIHVGYVEFDDVTDPRNLFNKGLKWLEENNKLKLKYSATALDLSLIGLDVDEFELYNSYPLKNPLMGITDTARIIKETIDICEEILSKFEFGEKFLSLSDVRKKQTSEIAKVESAAKQASNDLSSKIGRDEYDQIGSMLNESSVPLVLKDAQIKNSNGESDVQLGNGVLRVNAPWQAYEENMNFLVLRFVGAMGEECGIFVRGQFVWEGDAAEPTFKYQGIYAEQLSEADIGPNPKPWL